MAVSAGSTALHLSGDLGFFAGGMNVSNLIGAFIKSVSAQGGTLTLTVQNSSGIEETATFTPDSGIITGSTSSLSGNTIVVSGTAGAAVGDIVLFQTPVGLGTGNSNVSIRFANTTRVLNDRGGTRINTGTIAANTFYLALIASAGVFLITDSSSSTAPELSQSQVEDDQDTTFGLVTGERLSQAVTAHESGDVSGSFEIHDIADKATPTGTDRVPFSDEGESGDPNAYAEWNDLLGLVRNVFVYDRSRPQASAALLHHLAISAINRAADICVNEQHRTAEATGTWTQITPGTTIEYHRFEGQIGTPTLDRYYYTSFTDDFYVGTDVGNGRIELLQDVADDALATFLTTPSNSVIWLHGHATDADALKVLPSLAAGHEAFYWNATEQEIRKLSAYTPADSIVNHYVWRQVFGGQERATMEFWGAGQSSAQPESPLDRDDRVGTSLRLRWHPMGPNKTFGGLNPGVKVVSAAPTGADQLTTGSGDNIVTESIPANAFICFPGGNGYKVTVAAKTAGTADTVLAGVCYLVTDATDSFQIQSAGAYSVQQPHPFGDTNVNDPSNYGQGIHFDPFILDVPAGETYYLTWILLDVDSDSRANSAHHALIEVL